ALADAVPGRARAWHRAAATTHPDADVADALEELAADARSRGAPGVAARALERAADLSVDDAARGRRTLAAAVAAGHASRPAWALRLVDGLLEETDDPALRAQAVEQRGTALLQEGRPREAASVFEGEARRAQETEPFRAALLLIRAGAALLASGSVARLAELARDAAALLPPDAQAVPGIMEALALTATGRHDRARELLRAAKPVLDHLDPCGEGHEILSITAFGLTWLEELDDADALLWRCVTAAREAGAVGPLALPLATRGPLDLRLGAWDRALEHAEEVIGLADATDSGFAVALACATAAWVHAVRGDEELARTYAERSAAVGARHDLGQVDAYSSSALGLLHLSAGRPTDAATHLERSHRRSANQGTTDPGFVATAPDLVEALLADGRTDRAERVAALVELAARDGGGPWALAGAARVRLLLADDADLDATAADALQTAERLPSPFDVARTRLVVGERLRRARRRSDARAPLAQAAEAFQGMRAVPWERRARAELDACGGRLQDAGTHEPGGAADLTARERDVCELVVEGRTNREVAAALHLSPRTVEHHLRQAYRKLGVRSRTALAARWRADG
ncbi:LuxR family transcriptional regulator, partial [Patulibacter minatonensis]|uniref:LuxR family transcriptional regulator n=1 Tax=Patulibacter minatonensis TaxID=298163 RepID=UPI000561270A